MTKKQLLRSIAFFLVLAVMVVVMCDIFELENTTNLNRRFYTYRSLKKDSVDSIIMGTSGIDRFWIPSQAYEEYGMTVYPLATDAMPAWLYVPIIKDAMSYHDLDLIMIDIRPFGQTNLKVNTMDVRARRVLDAMSFFSIHRIEAAWRTMQFRNSVDPTASRLDLSYFFTVVKYHDKWLEDDFSIENTLGPKPHKYLGFYINNKLTLNTAKLKLKGYDSDYYLPLDPLCEEALYEVIEFIKAENLNVLFIDTPQIRTKKEIGRSNTVYKILEEEGMKYKHYYTEDTKSGITSDLGFDFDADYYNTGHVNYYGAIKYTDNFSKFLKDTYDLPDRRQDPDIEAEWGGVQEKLIEKIDEIKIEMLNNETTEEVDNQE